MIAISIIHIAILTNFAYSHAANTHFDFNAAMQPAVHSVDQLRRAVSTRYMMKRYAVRSTIQLGPSAIKAPRGRLQKALFRSQAVTR